MEIKVRNNNGISMIALIVTIMVLIILSGIVIGVGGNIFNETQNDTSMSELKIVKQAVLEKYAKYIIVNDQDILVGESISKAEVESIISGTDISLRSEDGYYRLTPELLTQIGISNSKDTYIVNYITGEVINSTKLKTKDNQILYTYGT